MLSDLLGKVEFPYPRNSSIWKEETISIPRKAVGLSSTETQIAQNRRRLRHSCLGCWLKAYSTDYSQIHPSGLLRSYTELDGN